MIFILFGLYWLRKGLNPLSFPRWIIQQHGMIQCHGSFSEVRVDVGGKENPSVSSELILPKMIT